MQVSGSWEIEIGLLLTGVHLLAFVGSVHPGGSRSLEACFMDMHGYRRNVRSSDWRVFALIMVRSDEPAVMRIMFRKRSSQKGLAMKGREWRRKQAGKYRLSVN